MSPNPLTNELGALKRLVQQASALAESAPVRQSLSHVLSAVDRLAQSSPPSDQTIELRDVCHFLRVRGEGLPGEEFERAAALSPDTFHRLERAAAKQSDLDQLRNGLAAARERLGHTGEAAPLLEQATELAKALAHAFANSPDVAPKPASRSRLLLDDACRVLEQLFRFTATAAIVRATGLPSEVIEPMRSAAAFAARRDG